MVHVEMRSKVMELVKDSLNSSKSHILRLSWKLVGEWVSHLKVCQMLAKSHSSVNLDRGH